MDMLLATTYSERSCKLRIKLFDHKTDKKKHQKSADIFIDEHVFAMYINGEIFKFNTPRKFDIASIKKLIINCDKNDGSMEIVLPLIKENAAAVKVEGPISKMIGKSAASKTSSTSSSSAKLWKLKRISDKCRLSFEKDIEVKLESNFTYGFANNYKGKLNLGKNGSSVVCGVVNPHQISPLQRRVDREILELKDFDRNVYCENFIELEIPDGHENPMEVTLATTFKEAKLSPSEEMVRHNIVTRNTEPLPNYEHRDLKKIDCGFLSILLAICYDIRTTNNEPTCESAWTRSILSPVLYNFDPLDNVKDVLVAFLRRVVIYPLYRNFDLGNTCILDAMLALKKYTNWIKKEFIRTHMLFQTSEPLREVFNRYYLEDYIKYIHSDKCDKDYFLMLALNMRNVIYEIQKEHLQLNLNIIEHEYVRGLISNTQMESNAAPVGAACEDDSDAEESDSEFDDDDDDDTFDDEEHSDDVETSSSSDGGSDSNGNLPLDENIMNSVEGQGL